MKGLRAAHAVLSPVQELDNRNLGLPIIWTFCEPREAFCCVVSFKSSAQITIHSTADNPWKYLQTLLYILWALPKFSSRDSSPRWEEKHKNKSRHCDNGYTSNYVLLCSCSGRGLIDCNNFHWDCPIFTQRKACSSRTKTQKSCC